MNKNVRIIAMAVLVAALAFVSCKKEAVDNGDGNGNNGRSEIEAFCGTYSLSIVTDSLQNSGTWFANSILPEANRIPNRSGRLTITKADVNKVNVLGRIDIAGDSVDYYRTTGTLDSEGRLQLEPGQPYNSYLGPKSFTFTPIDKGSTIEFKVDASYTFNGSQMVERSTNTATKR